MDWLEAGASLLGGILGGKESSKGQTTTSQNTIDPRIAPYIYGDANTTGIAPQAYANFAANPSGLNQQMLDGLNRQYSVYSDPNTAQGYSNMQSLGSQLMGAPVAGNPFTSGQATLRGAPGGAQSQPGMVQPTFTNPAQSAAQPFAQQTMQARPLLGSAAPSAPASSAGLLGSTQFSGNGGGLLGSAPGGAQTSGTDGNGMPGEGGGWTTEDSINAALNNPGTVSTVAGAALGPMGSFLSRLILSRLGEGAAPNTGQINNFGTRNDARQNAGIAAGMNRSGMNGGNSSGAGGDSSRGSQSSNGGRNGGDSGGF